MLNNPDASDKPKENEEVEFKEPPIQEDMKTGSTSQSVSHYVVYYVLPYAILFSATEKVVTFIFLIKWYFW